MNQAYYPYATGDILTERNTYFHTPYHGGAFLDAWTASRESVLRSIAGAIDRPPPGDVSAGWPAAGEIVLTAPLLERLYGSIAMRDEAVINIAHAWLDRLVRKFEVTKRMHRSYDASFRATDPSDHWEFPTYLRFAEVCDAAYGLWHSLPNLNALCKCLDTLCAYADRLSDPLQSRLARLIAAERDHIRRLEANLMSRSG